MAERKGCFQDIRTFVACYGILFLTDIMAGVMKRSSLTTLERRFDLPSSIVALISSSFQIGNMSMILVVSYFGSRWHRPRVILMGSILLIIGNVVAALPQFIGGRYEYEDVTSNASSSIQVGECSDNSTVPDVNCEEKEPTNQLYIFIIIGMMINGIGGTPHTPLGLSYIDDFAHESNSPLYVGLTHAIALLGPMAGYVLSALFLNMWVDIGWVDPADITIEPTNPSWVGAWWLGLLVCTSGIAVAVIPFFFFPKTMKKQEIKKKSKKGQKSENQDVVPLTDKETEKKKENDQAKEKELKDSTWSKERKEIWNTLKRIFSNKIYLLILLKFCFTYASFVGIYTFFPKYLEVNFGVSAARANLLTGLFNVPFLVAGVLLGSFLLKRCNLTPPGIIKLIGFASISASIFIIPLLFFGCDTIDIAGVTVPYSDSQETVLPHYSSPCNSDCGCSEGTYAPVCGADGISYISPCHAGCTDNKVDDLGFKQTFIDCGCLQTNPTNSSDETMSAVPERCEFSKCPDLVYPAIGLKAAASFFAGIGSTPMYIFLIRSVATQDKSFAIGVYLMTVRLLAIPMPLVYGGLIDSACLYWGQKACSERAYCKVYDNVRYRSVFFGIMVIFQICAFLTVVVMYFATKRKYKKDQKAKKNEEDTKTNGTVDQHNGTIDQHNGTINQHNGTVRGNSEEDKLVEKLEDEAVTAV